MRHLLPVCMRCSKINNIKRLLWDFSCGKCFLIEQRQKKQFRDAEKILTGKGCIIFAPFSTM